MDVSEKAKKGFTWQLYAILGVTVVPILAAYISYYTGVGIPESRVNEGTLLTPAKQLQDLITKAEGTIPELAGENKQWRLILPVPQVCDRECQRNLYVTRQVHIRLGDKADRLERYAVNLAGETGEQFLQTIAPEHPKLKHFSVDPAEWQKWLGDSNVPQDFAQNHYVLLVDQVGFAMMFYDKSNDGNQILKDIKRVLRYSPE